MAKDKEFKIPLDILTKLNECSAGGFIVFTFDAAGNPVINSQFDSTAHAAYMQSYISQWTKAIEDINAQIIANNILSYKNQRKKR